MTRKATPISRGDTTMPAARCDRDPTPPYEDDSDTIGIAPPHWLADRALVDETEHRYGLLTHPLAVFGCTASVANEPVPRWLDDHIEVRRRLAHKDDSGLGAETWHLVAEVAVHCGVLLRPRFPAVPVRRDALAGALAAAGKAARRLPPPPPSMLGSRRTSGGDETTAWWQSAGTIEAATVQLCRAIDDPEWTDPDALAGWIADGGAALDVLRRGVDVSHVRTTGRALRPREPVARGEGARPR